MPTNTASAFACYQNADGTFTYYLPSTRCYRSTDWRGETRLVDKRSKQEREADQRAAALEVVQRGVVDVAEAGVRPALHDYDYYQKDPDGPKTYYRIGDPRIRMVGDVCVDDQRNITYKAGDEADQQVGLENAANIEAQRKERERREAERLAEFASRPHELTCYFDKDDEPVYYWRDDPKVEVDDKGKVTDNRDGGEKAAAQREGEFQELFHAADDIKDCPDGVDFAIEGVIQSEALNFIGAPPASMKTYVALSMVKALLTGRPLFGNTAFAVRERAEKVVYLIPESSLRPLKTRLKKMGLDGYIGKSLFVRTVDCDRNQIRLDNEALLGGIRGSYVFLDTMARFMLGSENDLGDDQRQFAGQLFALLQRGALAVIGLHHATKEGKKGEMTLENMLRGSGDIATQPAMVWGIKKYDEEHSRVKFVCLKSRDRHPTPKPFAIEGSPWIDKEGDFRMVPEGETPRSKADAPSPDVQAKVDKLLIEHIPQQKVAKETKTSQKYVAERYKTLIAEGKLTPRRSSQCSS